MAVVVVYNRQMKTEQSLEDYLETILLLSKRSEQIHRAEIARELGVSLPAVTKAVKKLLELKYVITDGMHILLTDIGLKRAEDIYAKHALLVSFLLKLGVPATVAEHDACLMEHCISPETLDAIKKFIVN